MFSKVGFVAITLLASSGEVLGRLKWLERDNRAVFLHPRRFGQEHPAVIDKLSAACPGQVCGTLAGAAITPLLAAQPECSQQDMADQIIDAAAQFDADTQANMIALAIEYRQAEKNTPPDFSTQPPTPRNSVFCQTAPKNSQLNGLVQAQDPANDPNLFFDPALGATVKLGSQANTFPFGTNGTNTSSDTNSTSTESTASETAQTTETATATDSATEVSGTGVLAVSPCVSVVTVTVSGSATTTASDAVTVSVGTSATATPTSTSSSAIGDFGSCSVPQIEFGVGFDNRKETSFQPVDKQSYNHGSAQAIGIIAQFICDTLVNSCGADATAKATCATAENAVNNAPAKTGGQADAFNAVFGITTDFASVAAVDDQGNIVAGTGSSSNSTDTTSTASASDSPATASATSVAAATDASSASQSTSTSTSTSSTSIGNFGSCSVPQIKFGVGFDGRKETSFEPVDLQSYNHGSAQAIGIITQFICDQLVNSCGADATAKATCATAENAVNNAPAETGGQADAFNAVFGITTDFAAVAVVDDQGNTVSGSATGSTVANSATTNAAVTAATTQAAAATTVTSAAAAAATSTAASTSGANLQTFTGALGGVTAPAVTAASDGQFQVEGNSEFKTVQDALGRSCDVQHNQCANQANATGNQGGLTVAACTDQQTQCNAIAKA
ncbi:uncharacterized protein EV420DRAFT_55475 [Desarmillaria tabescens]|uniref:Uncharacterized protein n=1 Tax=Armillaria tabescens TaxID=1929756 RepID=A0AA39NPV0_ARMTA|nr:uncharacterized protein EV420DRAFT_55475 [Desarmillaria tabescens]KAK0469659.1 hypothetical protein EV420DRAFT_55475 [Desarmillaria tabescens]